MRTQEYNEIREQRIPPVFIETEAPKAVETRSPDLLPDRDARELILAARVEAILRSEVFPCDVVGCENGYFTVDVDAPLLWEATLVERYNDAVEGSYGKDSTQSERPGSTSCSGNLWE